MALDTLPDDGIIVKNRDDWRSLGLRSFKIRNPTASVAQDTQPWIDASVMADVLAPMSLNARTIGRSIPLSEVSGDRLDQRLAEYGLTPRFPETGSQGSFTITASTSGATIAAGVQWTDVDNGLIFACTTTGHYADQSQIPIASVDTGTQTNLDAGTVVLCSQSIPGLFASAVVFTQSDGSGMSGGRGVESDDEVRARISEALANPAAAGNDSAYQRLVENSLGHGVSVQKCFTYPACNGPGTIGVAFTMKPATTGASRRPNSTQMALVMAYVTGQMPADDSYLPVTINAQPLDISLDVNWATGAAGWSDANPWPAQYPLSGQAIVVSGFGTATSFTLASSNGIYTSITQPVVGQNLGFFDPSNGGVFRQKRILSFTGTGPWVITVDTSNGVSDTTYTPQPAQRACPWSDSLQNLVPPILDYFGTMGPGEMFTPAQFFDPGQRMRRNPVAPKFWPQTVSNKIELGLLSLEPVNDLDVKDGLGTAVTVGTPGAAVYIIELRYISAFAL